MLRRHLFGKSGAFALGVRCARRSNSTLAEFEPIHPMLLKRAEILTKEHHELEEVISKGGNFNLNDQKKFSQLASVVDVYKEYADAVVGYEELKSLLNDESLKEEAEQEIESTIPQLVSLSQKLTAKLLPPHPFADRPAILELRPGVGGVEAMIFTQDLLNMYLGYAQTKRWRTSIISRTANTQGNGITEAIVEIDEPGAYDRLRFEAGVHRVQRIPETETKGRTQTSTAAVVVLPKITEKGQSEDADERSFAQGEVRIDVMRASGKGGQHVNTTESAVRLTHIPSGIVVSMQDERSQHKNKAKAFGILRARLAELERVEQEKEERKKRTDQVSSTDRSDKIRTYNVPQNRVTDHRCSLSLHDVEGVLAGEKLDDIVDELVKHEAHEKSTQLLADLEKE
ncbi:CYFA0S08e03070g1_1 [Cyberlindnera fabianii]|uniref:Peptide chain release factor 1, mitochondrial n=1 Tax=Cyberlindnera fabianii TaxID=36022 RepID=A0A061AX01_CYBFA|nr:Peptide chain release factor 1, mitochondrial [Cyberlindnera fabianii]CDR42054.1 CYFA0S08e03070g1_1 [Cyberlindnera fabianii]